MEATYCRHCTLCCTFGNTINHSSINFEAYACEKHMMNSVNSFGCLECSFNRSKSSVEEVKTCAEHCFKMFKFTLKVRKFAGENVFTLDHNIKEEYANPQLWLEEDCGTLATSIFPTETENLEDQHLKLEKQDDYYEHREENQSQNYETPMKKRRRADEDGEAESEEVCSSIKNYVEPIEHTSKLNNPAIKQKPESHEEDDSRQLNRFLDLFYQMKKHPTFEELNALRELACNTRTFRDLFYFFQMKRKFEKLVCPENDTCRLGAKFIEMEREPVGSVEDYPNVSETMKEMFEEHFITDKPFTNGHSYAVAEKIGLPPKFIRYCYNQFSQNRKNRSWESARQTRPSSGVIAVKDDVTGHDWQKLNEELSADVLLLLEGVYLNRRSNCLKLKWTDRISECLSMWCGVHSNKISNWLEHRQFQDLVTTHCQLKDWQKSRLSSSFSRIQYPNQEEFEILSESVKVPVASVIQWFSSKQTTALWKQKLPKLPSNSSFLSEEDREFLVQFIGIQKEISMEDKLMLSKRFGMSVGMVNNWIQSCMEVRKENEEVQNKKCMRTEILARI